MALKIKDEVWQRVVQIVQLAMLTGTDVADYLRQIAVIQDDNNVNELSLDPAYEQVWEKTLEQLTERIVELQAQSEGVVLELPQCQDGSASIVGSDGKEQNVPFPSLKIGVMPALDNSPDKKLN